MPTAMSAEWTKASLSLVRREAAMQSFSLTQPPHQITALLPPVMLANKGLKTHS